LEQAWIGSEASAHQKAKNWFLFLNKRGTLWNKMQFYVIGLPGRMVWRSVKAVRFGGKERWRIIRGLWSGVKE
jgi:hypothetical protein